MKTLLDRANPLYGGDYHFIDIYLLISAAEDEEHVPSRAITGLEGWIECLDRAHLAGTVFAGGVTALVIFFSFEYSLSSQNMLIIRQNCDF